MELSVGISGASGAPYAVRLLQVLDELPQIKKVHLVISSNGFTLLKQEMAISATAKNFQISKILGKKSTKFRFYENTDFFSPIASGSYITAGMIVVPCSTGSLGHIAAGTSNNLIQRGAEVALKERRKLILVIRESPLSLIHLENCLRVTKAGGVILPAAPGFYHRPAQIGELIDFIVGRILDQFQIDHTIGKRWGVR